MAYSSVPFSCVCLYRLEKGRNKLLATNLYSIINAICSSSLSVLVYLSFMESLSTSESDPSWSRWLAQTTQGRTLFCSTFTANMLISSSKICFGELPLFNETILKSNLKNFSDPLAQLRVQLVVDKSYMQRTQRSCLTSRLLCV